jgi:hypothetical protein
VYRKIDLNQSSASTQYTTNSTKCLDFGVGGILILKCSVRNKFDKKILVWYVLEKIKVYVPLSIQKMVLAEMDDQEYNRNHCVQFIHVQYLC